MARVYKTNEPSQIMREVRVMPSRGWGCWPSPWRNVLAVVNLSGWSGRVARADHPVLLAYRPVSSA